MADTQEDRSGILPLPLMSAISALPPLSSDMYLAGIPGMAEDMGTSISTIQYSLSIFFISFAIGMISFGPLSDQHGRRPLALFGLAGFTISSLLIASSVNVDWFLIFRFFQGFLGGAATVVMPAMIRDCFGKNTAKGLSKVTMIMLIAPLVAPLLGSFLLKIGEWPLIFVVLGVYGFILLLLSFKLLPETLKENKEKVRTSYLGNYKVIFSNRKIYPDLVSFMLSSMAFFTFLTSVPFIYITYFGVSETIFGFLFAGSASALIVANFINVRIVSRFGPRLIMRFGLILGTAISIILVLISLSSLSVYWTVSCFILIVGCLGISSVNVDSLIVIEFPNQASSASAVTRTMRFSTGALVGPILAVVYNGTPVPVAIMILVAIAGALFIQLNFAPGLDK